MAIKNLIKSMLFLCHVALQEARRWIFLRKALLYYDASVSSSEITATLSSLQAHGYQTYTLTKRSSSFGSFRLPELTTSQLVQLFFCWRWRKIIFLSEPSSLIKLLASMRCPVSSRKHTVKPPESVAAIPPGNLNILVIMGWFGKSVHGGAENAVWDTCTELAKRGAKIEVWSTASSSLAGWNQDFLREDEQTNFKVRRFKTQTWWEPKFHPVHNDEFNREGGTTAWQRLVWKYSNLFGWGMEQALQKEAHRFDVIHLTHYLSGTAHRLSGFFPNKTILQPFLHDEPPLRNPLMRSLFAGATRVICNSESEINLAESSHCGLSRDAYHVVGNGVELPDTTPINSDPEIDALARKGFVLFIGRLVEGKNIQQLIDWHTQVPEASRPQLVFMGEGELRQDSTLQRPWITFLGFVEEPRKLYALKHALCLAQLSLLESFSLVMMEAWLLGTPTIVHSDCLATSQHIDRSGGGYKLSSSDEYTRALAELSDPQTRSSFADKGKEYVQNTYSWDRVCENYSRAIQGIFPH